MVGLHHEQMRIVVVKSSNHFRADFQPHASHVLVAKAAGPMAADPADLPWRKLPASTNGTPAFTHSYMMPRSSFPVFTAFAIPPA